MRFLLGQYYAMQQQALLLLLLWNVHHPKTANVFQSEPQLASFMVLQYLQSQ